MYYEDMHLGAAVEIGPAAIEREKMLAFAREYDDRAIHTDEDFAKGTQFGALLAPGIMTFMSVWFQYLRQDFCGLQFVAGRATRIEWHRPVYAGDVLTGRAEITALAEHGRRHGLAEITIWAYNQCGEHVLTDVTEAVVLRRTEETRETEPPRGKRW